MLVLGAQMVCGCEVTPEKIQRWKETEKGPTKLQDALKNPSVKPELRSQALAALVELGMVSDASADLKDLPEAQRSEVIHGAVEPLIAMAAGKDARGAGALESTTRAMREAKDALFEFRDGATADDRGRMDDAVVAWCTRDLTARMTAGAHASEEILRTIGSRSGPALAAVLADDKASEDNHMEAARLLGVLGTAEVREQAAERLVARARKQKKIDEKTIQEIAFVGSRAAVDFLTQLAENKEQPVEVRKKALLALALKGDPASLRTAIRIAGDAKADGDLREAAFLLAEKIGPSAVAELVRFLHDRNETVRWRAVEAALAAGKADAITPVLEGLPTNKPFSEDDLKSYVVQDLRLVGAAGLPALRDELKSRSWVARLTAAWAISEVGKPTDAAALEPLTSDTTRLKGWAGGATIGSQVKTFVAALRSKH